MIGRTRSPSVNPPAMIDRPRKSRPKNSTRMSETEQAVDDRWHAGQVGDVDLDDAGEPVVGRVLLEVDRGADADRNGKILPR